MYEDAEVQAVEALKRLHQREEDERFYGNDRPPPARQVSLPSILHTVLECCYCSPAHMLHAGGAGNSGSLFTFTFFMLFRHGHLFSARLEDEARYFCGMQSCAASMFRQRFYACGKASPVWLSLSLSGP